MPTYTLPFIEGFILSAGLIVGIGPQNTLILRQGIRRQHLMPMLLLCTLIDALLIALGTVGVGALLQDQGVIRFMTGFGILVLLAYGVCSFRAAFSARPQGTKADFLPNRKQVVLALLAVTLLNPSLYIDTLFLIGGGANHYQDHLRPWFAFGAIVASLVWFGGLCYGAALVAPWLSQPKVLRVVDLLSGIALWVMAVRLLTHLG